MTEDHLDLPESDVSRIYVNMTSEQKFIYRELVSYTLFKKVQEQQHEQLTKNPDKTSLNIFNKEL